MSITQQPFTETSPPLGELSSDTLASQRAVLDYEKATLRKWLYRLGFLVLTLASLLLEAFAVLAGGLVAVATDPALAGADDVHTLAVTYFGVATIATVLRQLVPRRQPDTTWLVWLTLLLALLATHAHGRNQIEALALWFVVAASGIVAVQVMNGRLKENVLAALPVPRTVAFLGNSEMAAKMFTQLRVARHSQLRVIGFFDDRYNRPGPLTSLLPCLGPIDSLVSFIQDAELSEVYMALPWSAGPRISQLIDRLRFLPLTVRLIPDHVPPALPGQGEGQLHGVVMPTLMIPPFSSSGAFLKRAVDVCAAALLMVPLVPLFVVVAICIRLDSRGPVFFRQVRSGQFGRPFRIFKFRSLHVAQADTAAETLVTAGDRRVTRVGQVLRKYSIDELPQVLNVLIGQMSLVGPRPHAPRAKADGRIYAEVIPEYMLRYRVKPGMTGWAQVNGWRGNTDTEEQLRKRVEYDFQYIGKWSFRRDIEIMVRTIPAMLLPPAQNV